MHFSALTSAVPLSILILTLMAIFTLSQTRLNHISFISEKRGIYQRIIPWESDSFPKTRWTPQRVRELVSQKFPKFHTKGRINPDYAYAYYSRGNVYYNQQKWDLALVYFTKAIAFNPDYAYAYYSRGNVYYNQQKWDLALADYNKAIAIAIGINSDLADSYIGCDNFYYDQKKKDLALADYNKIIDFNPDLADPYIGCGNVYYNQQKWDLALSAYTKAITIDPDYAQTYYSRGLVYHQLGNINKARKNLLRAAQLYLYQGNNADYQQVIRILNSL